MGVRGCDHTVARRWEVEVGQNEAILDYTVVKEQMLKDKVVKPSELVSGRVTRVMGEQAECHM